MSHMSNNISLYRTCNGKIDQHSPDITARYSIPLPQGYKGAVSCAGTLTLGKSGACQGDSGGPLMLPEISANGQTRWSLFGIVSGGIPEFCGNREHPTRFIRLDNSEMKMFIQENVDDFAISIGAFSTFCGMCFLYYISNNICRK